MVRKNVQIKTKSILFVRDELTELESICGKISFAAGLSSWTVLPLLGVISSLVVGGAAYLPFSWAFLGALLAILMGHLASAKTSSGLATMGLVMGYLFFGVCALSAVALSLGLLI